MSDEEQVPVIEIRGVKITPKGPKYNENYDKIRWDTYECVFCGCNPCQCKKGKDSERKRKKRT